MSKENNNPCGCNCNISEDVDSSKRDFIKRATAITVIGGTAFILEACGGGGSPTGPEDNNDGDNDNNVIYDNKMYHLSQKLGRKYKEIVVKQRVKTYSVMNG